MKTSKLVTILSLLMVTILSPVYAQDDTEPPEPELYTYFIPFSESTYSGEWSFRLEAAGYADEAAKIELTGYSPTGVVVFTEPATVEPNRVFVWDSDERAPKQRLQTLVLTADQPLTGVLWTANVTDNILNGVAIGADLDADYLIASHIPNDKYTWQTSISVYGVDKGMDSSPLYFRHFNPLGVADEGRIRSSLRAGGWYAGRPYRNIIIGSLEEDERAHWGIMFTDGPDFTLAGFQTFQRLTEENPISCALELQPGEGRPSGMVGFSAHEELQFSEWFAFTNPNDEAVDVHFELSYLPPETEDSEGEESEATGEEGEEPEYEPATRSLTKTVRFEPRQRVVDVLGLTLFEELNGWPYILSYNATALEAEGEDEEPAPLPILATHLQSNDAQTILGGHHFVDTAGRFGYTWLDLNGPETVVDIFNPTDSRSSVQAILFDTEGNKILALDRLEMEPKGAYLGLSNRTIQAALAENEIEVTADVPLRLVISLKSGTGVFTKITRIDRDQKGNIRDIAVVNGTMVTPEIEAPFQP
ncbi:MAG: hypothetical protein QNK37_26375 [Acidobacteriota bacterium]|nr:hypothetical protein [Acidobacteriota bacterium]